LSNSEFKALEAKVSDEKNWNIRRLSENLGPDKHIPSAIDWVLESSEGVVVIEDDIKISTSSILSSCQKISGEIIASRLSPVVLMSPLFVSNAKFNYWRTTKYFTAWGFALSREFWTVHKSCVGEFNNAPSIENKMKDSKYWQHLSARKKEIWLERIARGNYDYKIQGTLFYNCINVNAPFYRMSDNIGHGSARSTNTRFATPWYLSKRSKDQRFIFKKEIKSKLITKILIFADANTWAGDGLLSVRGRSSGVRSSLRKLLC
jgi:hypothetical protein